MADQVNATGGLAPSIPLALPVAPKPLPMAAKSPPAKAAGAPAPLVAERAVPTSASIDAAVTDFKAFLSQANSDLEFQVDKGTGRAYFRVVDSKTKEVIIQVPSEETLAMARKLRALADTKGASGVLVDKQG